MSIPITDTTGAAVTARTRLLRTPGEVRLASERWRSSGLSLGMVPTMGALHDGHRSLIRRARAECDRVVVSIFVNPRQFGADEDFACYPRPLERDLAMLAGEGVDAAYVPDAAAMYPGGAATTVSVGSSLTRDFEGEARPGHFDGVALVVAKLLIAARCDRAYFGQKDAQQCAVVRRLAADLDIGTTVVVCPTVRDGDGLALSSRNAYLSPDARRRASAIPRALGEALRCFAAGERRAEVLAALVRHRLEESDSLRVDYVGVVDADSFEPLTEAGRGARIVVAATIAGTRLIDTVGLGIDEPPDVPSLVGAIVELDARSGRALRSRTCSVR